MTIFLTILHILVCFILILVILLQAGRGQGLASASFGGGNVQTLFGTRAADFMTKATTVAAVCFILTSIGLDILEARKSRSLLELSEKATPINLEQIQKALEKVQAEDGQAATAVENTEMPAEAASELPSAEEMPAMPEVSAPEAGQQSQNAQPTPSDG